MKSTLQWLIFEKVQILIFWIFEAFIFEKTLGQSFHFSFFIFEKGGFHFSFFIFEILMREKITKYLFFPLKPKIITKLFCFLFVAAAIWCNQSRRPAVVYEYIRWQLLQIKSKKAWWLSSVSMGNINILLFFDALRMEVNPSRSQDWQYQKWKMKNKFKNEKWKMKN